MIVKMNFTLCNYTSFVLCLLEEVKDFPMRVYSMSIIRNNFQSINLIAQ